MRGGQNPSQVTYACLCIDKNSYVMTDHFQMYFINHSRVETVKFSDNQVNTMAADNPAFCVTRPSSTVRFNISDKLVLVFHK